MENNLQKYDTIILLNADAILKKNYSAIEKAAEALAVCNQENDIEPSNSECEFHGYPDNIPDPNDSYKSIRNLIVFDNLTPLCIVCDHSFSKTVTTLSELFSKVFSRSIREFIKKTGLYRRI